MEKKEPTDLPVPYVTIQATKSRIEKGLLGIPASLRQLFPNQEALIRLIDVNEKVHQKKFTPFESKSREARILGLRSFYDTYDVRSGDEIVICALGDGAYKVWPEKLFVDQIKDSLKQFEVSQTDKDADHSLERIQKISHTSKQKILENTFVLLSNQPITKRKQQLRKNIKSKEAVSTPLKKTLAALYQGKCQVSNFGFMKTDGTPYFEVHHIDASLGNHPKNLLVVSPNTHAQFEYAHVKQHFDDEGWLREVIFNDTKHKVFQIIDNLPKTLQKEVHYHP